MGYATAVWLGFGEALAAVSGALTGLSARWRVT